MGRIEEHEFKAKTKRNLALRANHLCSNPDCRRQTVAPKENDNEGVVNTGIAAHICANAENGPRFSRLLKPDQIRSIENAIWLCSDCATLIDRDPSRFPIELLKKWKSDHENYTQQNHGKKPPSENDAVATLTQAFSGAPNFPQSTAIKNTHKAVEQHLEKLDSRFRIRSSFINGVSNLSINATENCDFKITMKVPKESKDEFDSAWNAMINEGRKFLAPPGIKVSSDSKLLDYIFNFEGESMLSITPERREAVHKLSVISPEGVFNNFEDVKGILGIGSKQYSFEGSCCNGYFSINYSAPIHGNKKTQLNFRINYDSWNGLSYKRLPYFSKLLKFFEALNKGWELKTSLEIDGEVVFTSRNNDQEKMKEFAYSAYRELSFFKNLRDFLESTKQDLIYQTENEFHPDFVNTVYEYLNILDQKGKALTQEQISKNPTVSLVIDNAKGLELVNGLINSSRNKGAINISLPSTNYLINKQSVYFPTKDIYISGFTVRTNETPKIGKQITLEIVPAEGFNIVQIVNTN